MEWRKLHNEELNDLYCSPSNVRVTKSRRIRWTEHVARMGRGVCRVLVGKPEGKRQLGRSRRRWKIILRWIFRKLNVVVWSGSIWLRIGTEILQAVDRSIRTINTTGAAKGILRLPHRWQRVVHNAGDYSEGQ